ncbi:TadE-like protein [Duganella sp. CF402]|uniref:TadE/TadG family type IV pilus assembly protein n=1 Tax=unclassified Duganella TaxID=2636909 RepID=UPI0008C1D864|nr:MULTISPECIES: TadE/TadG family type IV pilus assembly protein [unclassified Duganella]RZT09297.1 TadE-like protein [Duganella sp. BK701]SEL62755.1 TadE-like protein [Duganella sp. CF402]
MWAIKQRARRGATTIEFALSALCFFTVLFFVMEVTRALYVWNTLQEATRRAAAAAAVSDFSNAATMDAIRQAAVLRDSAGPLPLGMPVTDAHIRIDYLSLTRNADNSLSLTPIPAASLPACPARALLNCIANPNAPSCIRFVRARLCAPGADECGEVQYQPLFPLTGINHALPQATTIAKAESLGYQPGSALCP